MPIDKPEITERLAWEGLINGWTALSIWLAFAAIAAWFLWRQRSAIGRGWAVSFWLMRLVAFGCAVWMLAGPTQQRIEKTSTSQSVSIFADDSESMDIVDPPEPAETLRWSLAEKGNADKEPVVRADRLAVALGGAVAGCNELSTGVKEHRPTKELVALESKIATATSRAKSHAEALVSSLSGKDPAANERATRIANLLGGPTDKLLDDIQSALEHSKNAIGDQFAAQLEQLSESLNSAKRHATGIAADLAKNGAENVAAKPAAKNDESRRQRTSKVLDALEQQLKDDLAKNVRIERYRFDHSAVPVSTTGGWTQALDPKSSPDTAAHIRPIAATPDSSPQPDPSDPKTGDEQLTNISSVFDELSTKRAGQATRLAILLSDGRHNDTAAAVPQEAARQCSKLPVYVVPIGTSVELRDVSLARVEAPSAVAEKDSAVIDVIVSGQDCDGRSTQVVLRHEGREVDRKPIIFASSRGDCRVRFTVPAKEPGWQEFIVGVEPIEGETNLANNYYPVSYEVVRDHLRILLADGVPRWEYRYLNQLFRRDQHIEFDELLFSPTLHGTGNLADHPEFPTDVEAYARYDVVILGDISPLQLSAASQQALDEFVRKRGGNLVVIAGQNSMPSGFTDQPLVDLLPVEQSTTVTPQQGYSLRLTDEGRVNTSLLIDDSPDESRTVWQETFERFPVYALSEFSRPKASARTLIEAVSQSTGLVLAENAEHKVDNAFLSWQRVGAGRVAYLAAGDTYRLRWRRGDRYHHRFWGQFLRWLTAANTGAGSEIVRLQTDRARYTQRNPVEVTVWLKDSSGRPLAGESIHAEARPFKGDPVSVELTPDKQVPGRYFGSFDALAPGAYKIAAAGKAVTRLLPRPEDAEKAQATITVQRVGSIEMMNTECNRPLLEQIAQITGGQVIPPTAIGEVLQLVSFTPEVSESIHNTPLWNRWTNLLLVLGCLFTEWVVRKGKGLS
jgi:hypothetical protein